MDSPIHGLYERPNISVALFISDYLQLAALNTVRFAWLLALGKLTVVAFFALFVVLITRASIRKTGGCDEALGLALAIGSLISFASMVLASQVGERARFGCMRPNCCCCSAPHRAGGRTSGAAADRAQRDAAGAVAAASANSGQRLRTSFETATSSSPSTSLERSGNHRAHGLLPDDRWIASLRSSDELEF